MDVPHTASLVHAAASTTAQQEAAMDGDSEQYELVSTLEPPVAAVADVVRLMVYHAGASLDDNVLESAAEAADFRRSLRYGPQLPVLFDNVACAEINQRQAMLAYLARALRLGGTTLEDATRAAVVAEMCVGWLAAPPTTVDGAKRTVKALQAALAKW
jgi:hypothetical protein